MGMSHDEAEQHVEAAFEIWHHRSLTSWNLDLTMLTGAGVAVRRPPARDDRLRAAEQGLNCAD
jgi:hypothetical protein